MKKLFIHSLALLTAPVISAASLGMLDFEADEPGFFSFAQNAAGVTTIQVIGGANGTDGVATRVLSNPGDYAGGGIGDATSPFNLGNAGILGGNVTTDIFNTISGSFDVNIPVGQSISIRLEPGNGGYDQRVDLGVTVNGTGAFQNVTFDVVGADSAQKTTLVNHLNGGNVLGLKFIYAINNQAGAVNSDFIFDNIELTSSIPEPSSALLAACGLFTGLIRRKR